MARAVWNGAVIAESDNVEVVDGYTYFPGASVDGQYLRASDHHSVCGWKGTASYYDVVVDGKVNTEAAWYYPEPSRESAPLVSGRIGFWRGVQIESGDGPRTTTGLLGRLADHLR